MDNLLLWIFHECAYVCAMYMLQQVETCNIQGLAKSFRFYFSHEIIVPWG